LGWSDSIHTVLDPGEWYLEKDNLSLMYGRPPESKVIEEYVKNFLHYERIMERSRDLVDGIEFTLQALTATATAANTSALSSD